ncbi:hypothetical protein VU08_02260 [Desulfobulbus sp. F5]|nr:hypothetical protein [Desulfobulbus sp. F5]
MLYQIIKITRTTRHTNKKNHLAAADLVDRGSLAFYGENALHDSRKISAGQDGAAVFAAFLPGRCAESFINRIPQIFA